jgi:shikimate dehydrogenase
MVFYSLEDFQKSNVSKKPHFFVIGNPVSHSLSPIMHQTALHYYKIDATYIALNLLPAEIGTFAAWCNRDEFLGCNITIPYKNQLIELVDEIDSSADEIGVINTIAKKSGKLIGFNTDVYGFLKPLEKYSDSIELSRAIVFGTGGASKAVKKGLEKLGFGEMVFVTRNPAGKELYSDDASVYVCDYSEWTEYATEASLVINTTPLGMAPQTGKSPLDWKDSEYLHGKICYDLVYNPPETEFLKQARQNGAVFLNGLDMLIYQGSQSFHIWTGNEFPFKLIREKLENHIYSR